MSRSLSGKRIILTGASGGIGRALAAALAREGANLVLAARSADALEEIARSLQRPKGEVVVVPTDVTVPEDRERLIHIAIKRLDGIDIVINNAGVATWVHFAQSDEAALRLLMETNFFGPVELFRLALPHLTNGNEPAVVNVASLCGRIGLPAWADYSASKFALCGISEALRGEMARFGIDVVLAVPGTTRVDRSRHMLRMEGREKIDFDQGMEPDYVAAQIVRALRSGKREAVIGGKARWLLRFKRFFPRLADYLMARRVRKLYRDEPATPAPAAS